MEEDGGGGRTFRNNRHCSAAIAKRISLIVVPPPCYAVSSVVYDTRARACLQDVSAETAYTWCDSTRDDVLFRICSSFVRCVFKRRNHYGFFAGLQEFFFF